MTTATINGRTAVLTIEAKARLLRVLDINEEGRLAVPSGSNDRDAYVVRHNGRTSTYCPCAARTEHCAHRVAVDAHLATQRQPRGLAETYCKGWYSKTSL